MAQPMSLSQGQYSFLPQERIFYGVGSLSNLTNEIERLGAVRALIITNRSLAHRTDVVDSVTHALGSLHAGTFAGSQQHVPGSQVSEATKAALALDADILISVGGGSVIDTSKAAALELAREYGFFLPQIALPTTLSAAEYSHSFGILNQETGVKESHREPHIVPRVVILDAGLTLATPKQLWLSSGIRALDHAIETLYAPGQHPINDVLALDAIKRLFFYLPQSHEQPDNLEVRTQLQIAAWMSFFSPATIEMGPSHALSKRFGGRYNIPHGITSCITLPHIMRALSTVYPSQLAAVGRAIHPERHGSDTDVALFAAHAVSQLIKHLELPSQLSDYGITPAMLDDFLVSLQHDSLLPDTIALSELVQHML